MLLLLSLSLLLSYTKYINGKTHYSAETPAPANAKSHSCFAQDTGAVRPSSNPQPVRYSTQFGPPAEVPVCIYLYIMLVLDNVGNGDHQDKPTSRASQASLGSGGTDLVLNNLVC